MTWDPNFRLLAKGEIVQSGDEVDICNDGWRDDAKWVPANHLDIGKPAPDPQYPSHRKYRRRMTPTPQQIEASARTVF